MPRPSHSSRFYHQHNTGWGAALQRVPKFTSHYHHYHHHHEHVVCLGTGPQWLLEQDAESMGNWWQTFQEKRVGLIFESRKMSNFWTFPHYESIFEVKQDVKRKHDKGWCCTLKLILKTVGLRMWPASTRPRTEFRERFLWMFGFHEMYELQRQLNNF